VRRVVRESAVYTAWKRVYMEVDRCSEGAYITDDLKQGTTSSTLATSQFQSGDSVRLIHAPLKAEHPFQSR
jgi:hypothetical protein